MASVQEAVQDHREAALGVTVGSQLHDPFQFGARQEVHPTLGDDVGTHARVVAASDRLA